MFIFEKRRKSFQGSKHKFQVLSVDIGHLSGWNYLHLHMLSQIQLWSFTDFNRHPFKTWEFWKGDCWNLESLASFSKMTMLITFINCLPLWNSLGGLKLTVECVKSDLCFCTAHWVKNWTLLRKDAIIGKCFHVNKLKLRITLTKVSLHFSIT